jgi:hypothetical protein
MLKSIAAAIFGCPHDKLTFPQSPRREGPLHRFRRKEPAHVTCIACGCEWLYDFKTMQTGKRIYPPIHQHPDIAPTLEREAG